jgi:enoyl-CoA hydratase/carnithine racemase
MDIDTGTERLIARKEGAIGFMIFNNPERRNAISLEMWRAIPIALSALDNDPEVRVIVYAGAGEKAFISGADISQFDGERGNQKSNERYSTESVGATSAMENLQKPSIAMIRGFCLGGGMIVALTCDLRIAAEDARFAIPAARLGLGYRFDGVQKLIAVVGPTYASEILFTARQFDAADALRLGLVNKVVPVEALESTVRGYAGMISDNAPLTIRAAKLAIREARKDADKRLHADVQSAIAACFDSQDYAEGRRAFLEKRKPEFRGR